MFCLPVASDMDLNVPATTDRTALKLLIVAALGVVLGVGLEAGLDLFGF